ncbi:hypothetical protein CBER1_10287 [Cercospora berteroae]|uniref:Uncharacterized protein n=1 Tax=Cercospora berteroae TaxID=357750 RepID=A0A2S6CN82_9PEZI|nr:hypothetical protein CBER1_10287 [Cercospora berteroae]
MHVDPPLSLLTGIRDVCIHTRRTTYIAQQHPSRDAGDMALAKDRRIDSITEQALADLVTEYPEHVPARAASYEEARYVSIPQAVSDRRRDGKPTLEQSEVAALVDWKLSHGTFRPKLQQLVQSNSPDLVRTTTSSAFAKYDGTVESAKSCLTDLCVLKGIGPATASLLLSVAFPDSAPFFSDELFRWTFWEQGKGKGWDRPIKYTPKEYLQLFEKVQQLRQQHDWSAVNMETAAYVLGRQALDKNASESKDEVEEPKKLARDDGKSTKRPILEPDDRVSQPAKRTKKTAPKDQSATDKAAKTSVPSASIRSSARIRGKIS